MRRFLSGRNGSGSPANVRLILSPHQNVKGKGCRITIDYRRLRASRWDGFRRLWRCCPKRAHCRRLQLRELHELQSTVKKSNNKITAQRPDQTKNPFPPMSTAVLVRVQVNHCHKVGAIRRWKGPMMTKGEPPSLKLYFQRRKIVMSDTNKVTPTKEQIRGRAYEVYEARGRRHGQDVDDWITAERELAGQSNRSAQKTRAAKPG